MSLDKFKYLEENIPKIDTILDTPVELVDSQHLSHLKTHFEKMQEKYADKVEMVDAIVKINEKILNIINLNNKTGVVRNEVIKASNLDYSKPANNVNFVIEEDISS